MFKNILQATRNFFLKNSFNWFWIALMLISSDSKKKDTKEIILQFRH